MVERFCYHARGRDHVAAGRPCQDAYLTLRVAGWVVFAVADGVGSRKHSERGARLAVAAAVLHAALFIKLAETVYDVEDAIRSSFAAAYHAVCKAARRAGEPSSAYDTTLCVGAWNGEHLVWGQAGDSGMVAVLADGTYHTITRQQRDEEGRVYPLRFGPETWEFGIVDKPVAAVLAATDGLYECLCPVLLKAVGTPVNVSLAYQLMHRTEINRAELARVRERLTLLLRTDERFATRDDATLVMLFDPERPAQLLDDAYYDEPDWGAVRREAIARRLAQEAQARQSGATQGDARGEGGAR